GSSCICDGATLSVQQVDHNHRLQFHTYPNRGGYQPIADPVDLSPADLYYHMTDTPTSVCSGACAAAWPPLLLPSGTPGSSVSLPGALGVETNVNGRQVTYKGHLLYRWKNDNNAGQATGEGINNFHVVTP